MIPVHAHKSICAELSCRIVLFLMILEIYEDCNMRADSLTLCTAMPKVHSQASRQAEPWPLWLAGMHDGSAFCMR